MSLVASSISGAAYVVNSAEDKDTGNGFEVGVWFATFCVFSPPPFPYFCCFFLDSQSLRGSCLCQFTRRKRWPQLLLQELVGATLFCLKPTIGSRGSVGSANEGRPSGNGWKVSRILTVWYGANGHQVMYVSPSVSEMLGPRPSDVEGREFFDYVYGRSGDRWLSGMVSRLIPSCRPATAHGNAHIPAYPVALAQTLQHLVRIVQHTIHNHAPSIHVVRIAHDIHPDAD